MRSNVAPPLRPKIDAEPSAPYTCSVIRALPANRWALPGVRIVSGTMATNNGYDGQLHNETGINVVALLKAEMGARRTYEVRLDAVPIGEDLTAREIEGEVRLTKLRDRILVAGSFDANVELECVRCLTNYGQAVATEFSEEYWQTVDVRSGVSVHPEDLPTEDPDDEERFTIDERHELDLREALRQHLVLALPMRPDCGDECPGPQALIPEEQSADEGPENPFAALAQLLDDGEDGSRGSRVDGRE